MKKVCIITSMFLLMACSCKNEASKRANSKVPVDFNQDVLNDGLKPIGGMNGQLLYMPVYSNIPYMIDTGMFDMSAFVAIHNTDLNSSIILTQVLYFNQDGKMVDDFLNENRMEILPLATRNFYIPYEDRSGTGANFLIEWISDTLVNEPLIESVTLCLKPNNTVAISSKGKILRQNR